MKLIDLKLIDVLKAKRTKPGNALSVTLSANDISVAEAFWIKSFQQSLLEDERFQTWEMQFGMYCDESGLWRCGGRLGNADLAGCETHPIPLHSEHHFTALVVNYCHKKVMHGGDNDTLTEFRSRFWIIRGRCLMRKLLHHCVVCRKMERNLIPMSLHLHYQTSELSNHHHLHSLAWTMLDTFISKALEVKCGYASLPVM